LAAKVLQKFGICKILAEKIIDLRAKQKKIYIYNNVRARKKSTTILKYERKIYKNLLKSKKKCNFAP